MNRVKLSVRVPMGQEVMIRRYAEARGLTRYQALSRVIEAGLGAVADAPMAGGSNAGDDVMTAFDARLGVIEALLDRSLFTASAAYAYGRAPGPRSRGDRIGARRARQRWQPVSPRGLVPLNRALRLRAATTAAHGQCSRRW